MGLCQENVGLRRQSVGSHGATKRGRPKIKPSPGRTSSQNRRGVRLTNQQPPLRGVSGDQHDDTDLRQGRPSPAPAPAGFSVLPRRKSLRPKEGRRVEASCRRQIENPDGRDSSGLDLGTPGLRTDSLFTNSQPVFCAIFLFRCFCFHVRPYLICFDQV